MKVTKKARLLAKPLKKVVIETLAVYNRGDDSMLDLTGKNIEGAAGYHPDASFMIFEAKVSKNGGEPIAVTFASEDEVTYTAGTARQMRFQSGDEVTVSFEVESSKPEYEQGTVTKTIVVP